MDSLREALREGVRRMADILCEYGERGEIDRPFIAACSEWQKNAVRLLAAPETWPSEEPTYRWRPSKEDNEDLKKKFGMYFPDCEPKGPVTPDRETPASPTGAIGLEAQAQPPKAIGDKILIYAGKSCWLAEVIQRLDDSAAPAPTTYSAASQDDSNPNVCGRAASGVTNVPASAEGKLKTMKCGQCGVDVFAHGEFCDDEPVETEERGPAGATYSVPKSSLHPVSAMSVDARKEALEEAAQAVEKYWASLKSQLGDELGKEAAEAIRAIAAKEPR